MLTPVLVPQEKWVPLIWLTNMYEWSEWRGKRRFMKSADRLVAEGGVLGVGVLFLFFVYASPCMAIQIY
jgi:hypothetical protein